MTLRFLLLASIACFVPLLAHAQDEAVFPVHGWLMVAATLQGSGDSPCILYNQYSDGTGLRFNIQGQDVNLVTVIYRQDLFDPGLSNTYKTILQTSGPYREVLDGYAYSRNTLTITPPDPSAFYEELKRNSRLTIAVPREQKVFNLRALAESLPDAATCSGQEKAATPAPVYNGGGTKDVHIYADLRLPKRGDPNSGTIWRASQGERLSSVMKRWSQRGGKEITWKSEEDPIIREDFVYEGSQSEALEKLYTQLTR